jgi:hypothetical protein
MAKLMDDLQNPEFQSTLEQTFTKLSVGSGTFPSPGPPPDNLRISPTHPGKMPPLEAFMDLSDPPDTSKHYNEDGDDSDGGGGGSGDAPEEKPQDEELEAGVAKTLQVRFFYPR